jgi:hypothetical protein
VDTTDDTVLEGQEVLDQFRAQNKAYLRDGLDYLLNDGRWIFALIAGVLSIFALWSKWSE